MSVIAEQVLNELEQRAIDTGVGLDAIDAFIAEQLRIPLAKLYGYLLVCFAAERCAYEQDAAQPVPGGALDQPDATSDTTGAGVLVGGERR